MLSTPSPRKALLVLESSPGHLRNLVDLSHHVHVEYLPRNTTALIQPMNQDVIATFKACYLQRVFHLLVMRATGAHAQSVVLDIWREYCILEAMCNISESWEDVPPVTLNHGWKKLWPECVPHGAGGTIWKPSCRFGGTLWRWCTAQASRR